MKFKFEFITYGMIIIISSYLNLSQTNYGFAHDKDFTYPVPPTHFVEPTEFDSNGVPIINFLSIPVPKIDKDYIQITMDNFVDKNKDLKVDPTGLWPDEFYKNSDIKFNSSIYYTILDGEGQSQYIITMAIGAECTPHVCPVKIARKQDNNIKILFDQTTCADKNAIAIKKDFTEVSTCEGVFPLKSDDQG